MVDLLPNPSRAAPGEEEPGAKVIDPEEHRRARAEIERWPGYDPTPLVELPGLARRTGVSEVRVKDEGPRFGLGSFKALGGAYGVFREVARELARRSGRPAPRLEELRSGRLRAAAAEITVTCATDGNHGRAVARGAELVGCRAVIYLPDHVSEARERAIADHGARTVRIDGSYDEAVERAGREADRNDRIMISDTSARGGERVPRTVMHGYTVTASEVMEQVPRGAGPTHVFLQAGVGGFAAAVAGYFREVRSGSAPRFAIVEPVAADALYQSALAGDPRHASGSLETVMGGLSCGEVSPLAWRGLREVADAFLRISDGAAVDAMRVLGAGRDGDPGVVAGESGAAGVAGFLETSRDDEARELLGLTPRSRVLLFVTEGATDPDRYRELTGRSPEAVLDGARDAP